MEDLENNPEKWKCYLDKTPTDWYYYHNWDWNWNWTGQARLDNIWFANFNSAKTAFNLAKAFNNIKITSVISNINWQTANWTDYGKITIIPTYIWSGGQTFILKNFKFKNIYFTTWVNSDILKNWDTVAWFVYDWNLITNEKWILTGKVYLFHPWTNLKYKLILQVSGNITLITTWSTFNSNILPPYQINLDLTWSEENKIFINYEDKIKPNIVSDPNISNLAFSNTNTQIDLWNLSEYFQPINTWKSIKFSDFFQKIEINYVDPNIEYFSWDFLPIKYYYKTDYSFEKNGNKYIVKDYTWYTNVWYMFKNWYVDKIWIKKSSDQVIADWKTPFIYQIKFLSSKNYPINHLSFNTHLNDWEKFFNLTWSSNTYITGFFIITWTDLADTKGIYKIWIISYKPISSSEHAFLTGFIENIKYNWHYFQTSPDKYVILNNPIFTNIVNLNLEETTININKETNISSDFISWWSTTTNWKYKLTWYIYDCPDCWFKEWKILSWDDFWNKVFTIYITGWNDPSELVYSGYFQYNLDGNYWNKKVYVNYQKIYNHFLYIWGWSIQIIWNVVSDKKILWWKRYISTAINPVIFKNKIKKEIFKKVIMGWNIIRINYSPYNIDLSELTWDKIYKCTNDQGIINIYGNYNKNINLYIINCQVNITSNILPNSWKKNLSIIAINTKNKFVNLENDKWWIIPWNIYIWPNVKTIKANLITDWSIFTYSDSPFSLKSSKIFISDRWTNNSLKKQLVILWKVFAQNTIWGGLQNSQGIYTIIGWKKVNSDWYGFNWISASTIAKTYDIQFWRNNFVKSDGSYDTWNLSEIILNKYHCTWNISTDTSKICSKSIIIMDSNNFIK